MTIFTMKGGKLEPVAVIKGGKTQRLRATSSKQVAARHLRRTENGTFGCRFCFC